MAEAKTTKLKNLSGVISTTAAFALRDVKSADVVVAANLRGKAAALNNNGGAGAAVRYGAVSGRNSGNASISRAAVYAYRGGVISVGSTEYTAAAACFAAGRRDAFLTPLLKRAYAEGSVREHGIA